MTILVLKHIQRKVNGMVYLDESGPHKEGIDLPNSTRSGGGH